MILDLSFCSYIGYGKMNVNYELGRVWKGAVVAHLRNCREL
jgi:hypothetical protein